MFLAIAWAAIALASLEVITDVAVHAVTRQQASDAGSLADGRPASPWSDVWIDLLDLPIFLALALLLASRLSSRTLKPLDDLLEATRSLAGSRFDRRVTVPDDDDLAELARSFNAMQASLHDAFERERTFARYAAHELRTPLAAMRVQVERVALGLAPADDVVPSLERHVIRTTELLDALATFGLAGDAADEPRPIHLLVQEAIESTQVARGSRVALEGDVPVARVRHARMVQQLVQNLIDNAIAHGVPPVDVAVEVDGEDLRVVVRDAGTGTNADTNLSRPHTGHGLGLAMVSSVTRALGGTFVTARTTRGFEARVTLPVVVTGTGVPSADRPAAP